MDQAILEDVNTKKNNLMKQLNVETYKGPAYFETVFLLRPNEYHDTTQKGTADRIFAESNKLTMGKIMPLQYEYHIRSELPRIR
ncbi:MAG: hypothetical protein CMB64_04930 [Euryarchaeota archaeon]|nr:hypothetical protein [Euryarchaeota archaeon]|tara:strand:+ start:1614 stop:1865 length:252 start_codon:yes stop_codon:yes gene_type:complete